jgi:hypothetical protein
MASTGTDATKPLDDEPTLIADGLLNQLLDEEQRHALDVIKRSGMDHEQVAATIEKMVAGKMTYQEAIALAAQFPKRLLRRRPPFREV